MVFKLLGWEWELQLNGYIFAGGKTHLHLNAALVHSNEVHIKELH